MAKAKPTTWAQVCLRLRDVLDMSQDEFARGVGCHMRSLSRWESGACRPSRIMRHQLAHLAGRFNIPIPKR